MNRARCLSVAGAILFSLFLAVSVNGSAGPEGLERGFRQPPDSARPWVYYFIMDGNLSREGITADFEALKRAGIAGLLLMEVDVGIPRGPVKFMSPEWRQIFKHAVAEAERLGLQITLNAGPGWTGSGGPWVKPEQSMQHIVASTLDVSGPTNFTGTLPRPAPRAPYFGNAGLPADLLKAQQEFYVDVAVMAFPKPGDAAKIADIDEKALYLRHPYSSMPGTKPFLSAPANRAALPTNAVVAGDRIVDLSQKLDAAGRLTWDVPPGHWTILRFGRTSTGANTRPAPLPGLGLECDKLDPAALDAHFDAFIGALLRDIGPRKPSADGGWTMLHIDSWEMGAQNWTAHFRDEFLRRRGYDPVPYLPAVTGRVIDNLEISERFLWDLRQTAQELTIENHAVHLRDLGHQHGFGLSIEPYDMNPCADLSLGSVADVPMGEFWLYGFKTFFSVIEAASIAHTCGRPVVAAESFTSDDSERWQAYPGSMKTLGDWAFSMGVNRIVFHRSQHQPQLDHRPGMTMGPYGVHWERTQTWWDLVPAYHTYLARCQFLLRQGLAVADICYLAPEGAPQVFRPPKSATQGSPPDRLGYSFDGCAPETLLKRMSVKDGRLVLPDGMSYQVLVLPQRDTMTPALLSKVKELVQAGATVIGPPPLKSPSLTGYPACDREVKRLAVEQWGEAALAGVKAGSSGAGPTCQERRFGQGRMIWDLGQRIGAAEPPRDPLAPAKWIWHAEGQPAASAPAGKRYFRKVVTLDPQASIRSASVSMTADNSFVLFVNGQRAGNGDNFHETYSVDVTSLLKPGANLLAVEADNGGDGPNPAGLIGCLAVQLADGKTMQVPTDRQWETAKSVEGDWTKGASSALPWTAALELGPPGMAPWNRSATPAAEPEQYGDFALVTGVLNRMGVKPDFESDGPVRYLHRRLGTADLYFVANRDARDVDARCTFRVVGRQPELWDPLTGEFRELPEFTTSQGRTTVPIHFAPAQSFFMVFRKAAPRRTHSGRNFAATAKVLELTGFWEVSFDPKWGGPEAVTFNTLDDWSKRPETGIKFYSGMAIYRKTFDLPAGFPSRRASAAKLFLDMGTVKDLARVRLNGQEVGTVWCAPWRVDLTRALKSQGNQLEITVANLWPNRLIGDQSLPVEQRLTSTTWNPFKANSALLESGLLGPVTLRKTDSASLNP